MRHLLHGLLATATLLALPVHACDPDTGERSQRVVLDWNGSEVKTWKISPGAIEPVELPNGFKLGVRIDPATDAFYSKQRTKWRHPPEMVRIELFDLSTQQPRSLTHTWGGANSQQGYGAGGGADRVDELGDPGILMTLLNPLCAPSQAGSAP